MPRRHSNVHCEDSAGVMSEARHPRESENEMCLRIFGPIGARSARGECGAIAVGAWPAIAALIGTALALHDRSKNQT